MAPRRAFPKNARLRNSREFSRVMDHGLKAVCPSMVLFLNKRPADLASDGIRMGLVVSRRVGNAVVRNRVKRQLREAFRHVRAELDLTPELRAADLVVLARAHAGNAQTTDIASSLKQSLRRLQRQIGAPA